MNPAPDADPFSVGEENYRWVIDTTANVVIEKVLEPQTFEATGTWPSLMRPGKKTKSSKSSKGTKRTSTRKKASKASGRKKVDKKE